MMTRISKKLKSFLLPHIKRTSYYEEMWTVRTKQDVEHYIPTQDRASRSWLAEKISASLKDLKIEAPKILEIGCDLGANLYSLRKIVPASSELVGIDIAPASISAAKEFLDTLGVSDIAFHVARADDLEMFNDNYFDVVFTDAVLLYLADDKINQAIREMARVSKKLLFLLELSPKLVRKSSYHSSDGWIRDYELLIQTGNIECDIKVESVTKEVRSAGRWPSQGKLIKLTSPNGFCQGQSS